MKKGRRPAPASTYQAGYMNSPVYAVLKAAQAGDFSALREVIAQRAELTEVDYCAVELALDRLEAHTGRPRALGTAEKRKLMTLYHGARGGGWKERQTVAVLAGYFGVSESTVRGIVRQNKTL